jgi:hypothetical protein
VDQARTPTGEDADLLFRLDDLAARPETRAALDWSRRYHLGAQSRREVVVARRSREYEHVPRFMELFERMGTLVKRGVLNEELVHERWMTEASGEFLRPTVERERRALGPEFAADFQWLGERARRISDRLARKRAL